MKYGICHLSVVPCRAEASDRSEQVTQLLFGELIKVYEKKSSWYRIKHANDGYECYIDEKQFKLISQREFDLLKEAKPNILPDLAEVICDQSNGERMSILIGRGERMERLLREYIDRIGWLLVLLAAVAFFLV